MSLYFCRSYPFQNELANQARFFLLKVRISGVVDSDSGMAIDLTSLDQQVEQMLGGLAGGSQNEGELVVEIFQNLVRKILPLVEIEIQEPESGQTWGHSISAGSWNEIFQWVEIQSEKKKYSLRIRGRGPQSALPQQYGSIEDLQEDLIEKKILKWSLREPVTQIAIGT